MISSCRCILLVSLVALSQLCNVMAAKGSYAKMVKGYEQGREEGGEEEGEGGEEKVILTNVKHDDRALTVWVEPKYWNSYNKCFTSTRLNKCLLISVPPLQGSLCLTGLLGWHSCFFGSQTCTAITGPLPGLGNLNCVGLGLDHPKTRCDCNNGAWNCYDWKVCQASPILQPLPSPTPVPTYLRTPRPTPVPTPLPTPVPTPLPTPVPVSTPIFCGGIAGILCPNGLICIDNPNDYCDPMNGGADCGGLCIVPDIPQSCTSNGLSPCPYGQTCFDLDQTDSCSLLSSCPGVCVSIPPPSGCGGQLDIQCPSGQICIDDLTNCGLAGGCLGKCILAPIAESLCSECPIESPLTLLNDLVCANQLICTYGKESCCGSTYDSLICSCQPGTGFFCYATDKCLSSVCAPKLPVGTLLPPVNAPLPPTGGLLPTVGALLPTVGILSPVGTVLPPTGGLIPPTGGLLPTVGALLPTVGILPPVGTVLPPTGGLIPPTGGLLPTGGILPPVGTVLPPAGTVLPPVGALLPTVGALLPTVLLVPDVYNNQYCPNIVPQSNQLCPLSLLHGTSCSYGEVCCCNDCRPKTICLANFGTFQCLTIDIPCTINCLLPVIPAVCIVKKKSWPELVGLLHLDAKAIILKEEPCVINVDSILEGTPVTLGYIKTRVRIFYSASSGRVLQAPQCG